ncbi:hypothetical protein C8R45DRAFT_908394 [Mycena sanguinolenta]|nr:hypothetical protein C8R45DRAFT_908394 [Mycena sanguinolenta]
MFPGVQTMNNYINGGRGGGGGEGRGSGTGGAGGHGMGPSLNFDIQSSGNFTVNNVQQRERGIDILHRAVALEAIHNSAESFPQPRCHPETRTTMLEDLQVWALDPNPETTVLWLYGPAGAGKSAIMQTLAGQLKDGGVLGGSFFFKRGHARRGNARTLFTTLAYQLALNVRSLRTPISQIVESNPSIVALSVGVQMRNLILEPCRSNRNRDPIIILIDGLDECEGHNIQLEILRIIGQSSSQEPCPLRFIIASRPEPHIREVVDAPLYLEVRRLNVEQSFEDVHKYLRDEFSRIHREHDTMKSIPLPWPSSEILWGLVQKSSGHFIYASTIIKFIDDKNYRPTERLAAVQDPSSPGSKSAFDPLDQLYMTILVAAPRQSQLIPILCAIVHFQLAACEIDQLLRLLGGETRLILRGLHSVLYVPSVEMVISSHHASFGDFLSNPDRSGNFCVGTLDRRIRLARSFLRFYASPFRQNNICLLSRLVRFIISLPPSHEVAELLSLIGSVNPDYIFDPEEYSGDDYFGHFVSWLKNNPSAPADVIQLWEDYALMFSVDMGRGKALGHSVSPSPKLLFILISLGLLRRGLWELHTTLELTWTDLRTTLCSLRPKFVGDEHTLPIHQPQAAYPWAARDLALQLIRRMAKNHSDTDGGVNPSASRDAVLLYIRHSFIRKLDEAYDRVQYGLGCDISDLVRLSPPCPALYRELWLIPPSALWASWSSGHQLIQNVATWLESFPDSTTDLITLWQKAVPDPRLYRISPYSHCPDVEERNWCDRVESYNDMIAGLHLPDSLKIISSTQTSYIFLSESEVDTY